MDARSRSLLHRAAAALLSALLGARGGDDEPAAAPIEASAPTATSAGAVFWRP